MKKENILVAALILLAVAGVLNFHYSKSPESRAAAVAAVTGSQAFAGDEANTKIDWQPYKEGLAKAKTQGKNVFLYFHAPWCTYCTKLKKHTLTDKKVLALMNEHFVSISVDTDQNDALAKEWEVRGLPTVWFLEPDGSKISSLPGYVEPDHLEKILKYIQTKSYNSMTFPEFVNKS